MHSVLRLKPAFPVGRPRWLLEKGRPRKAYESLLRLRNTPIEAARDLFYIGQLLKVEASLHRGNRYAELFSIPRNARATMGATIVMFTQQFCGINVIAVSCSRKSRPHVRL